MQVTALEVPSERVATSNASEFAALRVRDYVCRDMYRIKGGIHLLDAYCFAALLLHQNARRLPGSVAEIGVGEGRSYFLLARALLPGQAALAADIFEGEIVNGESTKLREFKATAAALGIKSPTLRLFVGPSERMQKDDIENGIGGVRFFSVDGGHQIENVIFDSALASEVLLEHGIIAFDDFGNSEWPDVAVGVIDFLRQRKDQLTPLAITRGKLYACAPQFKAAYTAALSTSPLLKRFVRNDIPFLETTVLWLHQPTIRRAFLEGLHKLGLGSAFAPRQHLWTT